MGANQSTFKNAYEQNSSAQSDARKKLFEAKHATPQDKAGMEAARSDLADLKSARKKIHQQERAFNEKVRSQAHDAKTAQEFKDNFDADANDFVDEAAKTERTDQSQTQNSADSQNTDSQSQDTEQKSEGSNKKGGGMSGFNLSDSFYRDVGAMIKGKPTGNKLDAAAATAQEQAQNYRNRSAQNQMEAQASQQIANRNEFAEAGKIASVQNDAQNRQNIANKEGLSGAAAAMQRSTNAPDVQAQPARQDQQRNVANQRRDEANTAQEEATGAEGDVKQYKIASRDMDTDLNKSQALSKGEGPTEPEPEPAAEETTPEETTAETPQETEQEQAQDTAAEEEETTPPEDQPPQPESSGTNWQHVMNYITFGNDPTSGWSKGTKDEGKAQAFAQKMGWKPITLTQEEYDAQGAAADASRQEKVKAGAPEFYSAWEKGSGRIDENGKQTNVGDNGATIQDFEKADVDSDLNLKNIHKVLSDMRMKWIKEDWDRDGYPSKEDFEWLLSQAGKLNYNDQEYELGNDDEWGEDVTNAYADHIRNYVYNYKPGAEQIDPRNDPNQEHIGPMAQDIEQVNPACVKEDANGFKSVDTARLAMMNAGAIGDLSRKYNDLVARLAQLEAKYD